MKNFDLFVKAIVSRWRAEKETVYESVGLGMPANRLVGDAAEKYVARKISKLKPLYSVFFPSGSQTPSDLYSVARRNGYWHIMLTQVKCSTDRKAIYELNKTEIEQFSAFAKFVEKELLSSELLTPYNGKAIIISIGYAGVYSNQSAIPARHQLITAKLYKMYKSNCRELNLKSIREHLVITHDLRK